MEDVSNYRPISRLPLQSKLLEKHINKYLSEFIEASNCLDASQSGFRPRHSMETALVEVIDNRASLDSGQAVLLVLLDLSTAFDTISHQTLRGRLKDIGLRGNALKWMDNFLSERTQTIHLGPFHSETTKVTKGVPQGSCLSPTLFNIYVTPLARLLRNLGFCPISYADDTQLLLSFDKTNPNIQTTFAEGMKAIANWMKDNFLQLNAGKSEIMLFGEAKVRWSPSWWPEVLGPAPNLKMVVKNLGVRIDQKLTLGDHISSTAGACFHSLSLLRRVFPFLPLYTRKTLVQALVLSCLDYCNALLITANERSLNKLQVVQNTAARLVDNAPSRTESLPLLQKLHWLPVRQRITFKICCMVYKSLNNLGPNYVKDKTVRYLPPRPLRSEAKALLLVLRIKKARTGGVKLSTIWPHDTGTNSPFI